MPTCRQLATRCPKHELEKVNGLGYHCGTFESWRAETAWTLERRTNYPLAVSGQVMHGTLGSPVLPRRPLASGFASLKVRKRWLSQGTASHV